MNVTDQVLRSHIKYGGSDNTNPSGLSASYSLNYAKGGSITNPDRSSLITHIPFTLNFKDAVGLFGAENYYHRVDLRVDGVSGCIEPPGWECAEFDFYDSDRFLPGADAWEPLKFDLNRDTRPFNGYEPATVNRGLPNFICPKVEIVLKNNKTGNIYVDDWLDVSLYRPDREEHGHPAMWIPPNSHFYIGFHARNTKRLPYDVSVTVGAMYMPATEIPKRLLG